MMVLIAFLRGMRPTSEAGLSSQCAKPALYFGLLSALFAGSGMAFKRQHLLLGLTEVSLEERSQVIKLELAPEEATTPFSAVAEDKVQALPRVAAHAISKANS